MSPLAIAQLTVPLLVVAIAVAFERRTGEIPNWLTLGALVVAVPLAWFSTSPVQAAIGFFLGATVAVYGFKQGFVGGGAVKLLAAVGALTSWHVVAAATALAALVFGALFLRPRGKHPDDPTRGLEPVQGSPLIAAGTVIGLLAARFWP